MYQIRAKYEILVKVSFLFISTLNAKKEKNNFTLKMKELGQIRANAYMQFKNGALEVMDELSKLRNLTGIKCKHVK